MGLIKIGLIFPPLIIMVAPAPRPYSYSEPILVSKLINKDQDAMNFFYDTYAPVIFGIVQLEMIVEADASGMFQLIFTRIFSEIERYDSRKVRLLTWVLGITKSEINASRAELPTLNKPAQPLFPATVLAF